MEMVGETTIREIHLRTCDSFRDLLDILNVAALGLADVVGDPQPAEAAMIVVAALDEAGYRFVRVIDNPDRKISDAPMNESGAPE